MRKLLECVRVLIISPEGLSLLLVAALALYFPNVFRFLGARFDSDEKLWEFIPAIPVAVLSFVVYLSFQLQSPVEAANRELYDWDQYWALKYRIVASIAWAGLAALFSLAIWFFSGELPHLLVGCLFIGSQILCIVVAATAILALFTLKEILAK